MAKHPFLIIVSIISVSILLFLIGNWIRLKGVNSESPEEREYNILRGEILNINALYCNDFNFDKLECYKKLDELFEIWERDRNVNVGYCKDSYFYNKFNFLAFS